MNEHWNYPCVVIWDAQNESKQSAAKPQERIRAAFEAQKMQKPGAYVLLAAITGADGKKVTSTRKFTVQKYRYSD